MKFEFNIFSSMFKSRHYSQVPQKKVQVTQPVEQVTNIDFKSPEEVILTVNGSEAKHSIGCLVVSLVKYSGTDGSQVIDANVHPVETGDLEIKITGQHVLQILSMLSKYKQPPLLNEDSMKQLEAKLQETKPSSQSCPIPKI